MRRFIKKSADKKGVLLNLANSIYTPKTLWEDFTYEDYIAPTILSEKVEDGIIYKELFINGKSTEEGVTEIYAISAVKQEIEDKIKPAVLIMAGYSVLPDFDSVRVFAEKGYFALMINYSGVSGGQYSTSYPDDLSYAVYNGEEDDVHKVSTDAKHTCWYEWCVSARYALRYIKNQKNIGKVGGFGVKHGATLMWQLAATDNLSCVANVFSAGWRIYRGYYKFDKNAEPQMSDETYRYLAAIEAESYAQSVSVPVLMMTTTNNEYFDADRVNDTLNRVQGESFLYYSVQRTDILNSQAFNNTFMFFNKYLKGSDAILPSEIEISAEVSNGRILVTVKPEKNGLKKLELFSAEAEVNPHLRCWNKSAEKIEENDGAYIYAFSPNRKSKQAFFLAGAHYENGFAVYSKIINKRFEENEISAGGTSNIVYSSRIPSSLVEPLETSKENSILSIRKENYKPISVKKGAFDIEGVTAKEGLLSLKITPKFKENSESPTLCLDVYAPKGGTFKVGLIENLGRNQTVYYAQKIVKGGKVWHDLKFDVSDFKTVDGFPIKSTEKINAVSYECDADYLINNVLWI